MERRAEPRTAHRAAVIMACGRYEKMEFEDAVMVDCSRTGICIELPRALEMSSSFLLKPSKACKVMLIYDVRRCTQRGDKFQIGGEYGGFVGTPNKELDRDEVLKMLLALEPKRA